MDATPKKLSNSDTKCFICSVIVDSRKRIRIFKRGEGKGSSTVDLHSLIDKTLDIDVNVYANSDVAICIKCYKTLNKYQKAEDHLQEIKKDLKNVYEEHRDRRVKRLHRDDELPGPVTKKQLVFEEPIPHSSFTVPLLKNPIQLSPIGKPQSCFNDESFSLVYNAFAPYITSTPVRQDKKTPSTETKSTITVEYPSKTVNKKLSDDLQPVGKALAHGPPSRIAKAVFKSKTLRTEVIAQVLRTVSTEVSHLCSRKNPSLLRKTAKDDLLEFDLNTLCDEWKERAPTFYAFLLTCCSTKRTIESSIPSIAVSGSILLKKRNNHMSATANILGILLKTGSIQGTLNRFSKLKITSSNYRTLVKLETIGESHDACLQNAREAISREKVDIAKKKREVKDIHDELLSGIQENKSQLASNYLKASAELKEQQKNCHPGFVVPFDNIDFHLSRRNMTMSEQNKDVHWINHSMVENRVSGNHLSVEKEKDVLDVPNLQFFPNVDDQRRQRVNYIVLVSRILVDYFDEFAVFKGVCVRHIPHKYSKELSVKSSKTPLGIIFKNENVNEEMLSILKDFHNYLPTSGEDQFDSQLFAGDQLTVERAANVINSVSNGYSAEDRLEGINLQLGDWHAAVKLLELIYRRFYSPRSDVDQCTMYSDRTLINRRNVTQDPHSNYRANRDYFLLILKSRVIAAAMKILGLESKTSKPSRFSIPENISSYNKLQKLEVLHKAASMIVDKFVFTDTLNKMVENVVTAQEKEEIINQQVLTDDGRFPCRFVGCNFSFKYDGKSRRKHELTHDPPPIVERVSNSNSSEKAPKLKEDDTKKEKLDDIFNYNCAILTDGLFFLNFLDSISEGDGLRTLRQYKYMMLYCKADGDHSTKYALECLYQFFLVNALLSPRDCERFIWNRSVNNAGGIGRNIALDLDTEHSNNYLKQAIKNLGPNLTEKSVTRICRAEKGTRTLLQSIDKNLQLTRNSGKHSSVSLERDLSELVKRLVHVDAFRFQERNVEDQYTCFSQFKRDPFQDLDLSKVYKWINVHKKNINTGIKAR